MFCHSCGKEIPDNSKHCGHCGVKQDVTEKLESYEYIADVPETTSYETGAVPFDDNNNHQQAKVPTPPPPSAPPATPIGGPAPGYQPPVGSPKTNPAPTNQPEPKRKSKAWLIILIILLTLGIFTVVAILLGKPLVEKLFHKEETTTSYSQGETTDEVTTEEETTVEETTEEETAVTLPSVAIKDKITLPPAHSIKPVRPVNPDIPVGPSGNEEYTNLSGYDEPVTTPPSTDEKQLAINAVKDDFNCFKYLSGDDLVEFLGGFDVSSTDEEKEFTTRFLNALFRNFDYKVLSAQKINNTTYYVYVQLTTTDCDANLDYYAETFVDYILDVSQSNTLPSDDEIADKTIELTLKAFERYNASTQTINTTVEVNKVNGVWQVNYTDQLLDELMGNLYAAYADCEQKLTDALKNAYSSL